MTKIMISEDCGNSPKNLLAQELTIALATGDAKSVMKSVTDDIRWNMVGDTVIQGKDHLAGALDKAKEVLELTIHHVTTHGKAGAVNGTRKFKNIKTQAFCHVYEFSNAKGSSVKEITSYMIEAD
jgi:hypothetical protein